MRTNLTPILSYLYTQGSYNFSVPGDDKKYEQHKNILDFIGF